MRVRLTDPVQVSDLLSFLRERGCIAYQVADLNTIEVLRPEAVGGREPGEIRALVRRWQALNPAAAVELE